MLHYNFLGYQGLILIVFLRDWNCKLSDTYDHVVGQKIFERGKFWVLLSFI